MKLKVKGRTKLQGEIEVSSSKNAILPILAASLLSENMVTINKVPDIKDVQVISELIKEIGVSVNKIDDNLYFHGDVQSSFPPFELVRQIRASFLVMGPLLAKKGNVRVSLPGGCAIGTRPIDLHLKGFRGLGANISLTGGDIIAKANKLYGSHIYLDFPSVGATENIMMAATLAKGTTYIENAALEPEIVDLANFINQMGGKVIGAGSNVIKIEGVNELNNRVNYTPIPDRIEAGTYMVAAAATGGKVIIKNVIPEHIKAITAKLAETGVKIEEKVDSIIIQRDLPINPVYIKTLPYPGFPTDMQAQFMTYLSCGEGSSVITESVFENRFMHVQELSRMGANIKTEGRTAIIKGTEKLTGASVRATDLRAGAALLIAAMIADGESNITESEHIYRGYENIIDKLNTLGADIVSLGNYNP
ncbi:MAG TPA: UDP-N-acetylglucosamine 1-carboxyvinyltransferase [Syntrophomonadaceae bacterium]|nr:UDP-N-acetylglucosamine 1-carboxyvinyltransferase [Syntrophomonadaceae bacterium]